MKTLGIGIIPSRHRNSHIKRDHQPPLQVITLLILQESADGQNRQNQHDQVKDIEVQIHMLPQTPGHNHRQRCVEQGRLERRAEDVGNGKVHRIIPRFVDGGEMFCEFLYERHQDETDEGVGNIRDFDNVMDLQDEDDSNESDESDGYDECDDTLRHCETRLAGVLVTIVVAFLVVFEDGGVDTMVGLCLEEDEDAVGCY